VLRMKEHKRGPGFVGLGISVIITALLLAWSYSAFPQLRPTVIGWTGHQVQKIFHKTAQLPDLAPAAIEHGAPPERGAGENEPPPPPPAPEAGAPPPAHQQSPPG